MKKIILLSMLAVLAISCQRKEDEEVINEDVNSLCNKTVNPNSAVNPWGVLSRYTCKEGDGNEAPPVAKMSQDKNTFFKEDVSSKVSTKAAHFWFYGTATSKLFKPVTYARVFVFNDDVTDKAKIDAAKGQILNGNHYLGFDSGVFQDIYPYIVLNINHKLTSTGTLSTSYNLESEVKRSLPTGKRIFVQFIVQTSPTNPLPSSFASNKYAYCEFVNADDNLFPHFKIDLSDDKLGYQGNSFFYN